MKIWRVLAVAISGVCLSFLSEAVAEGPVLSRGADTEAVDVTVYSSGRGLVHERRAVNFAAGEHEVRFMDVAREIMPETVAVAVEGGGVATLEQNYEYDLLTPGKLLDKFVGRELTLGFLRSKDNTSYLEEVRANLLANNEGPVFKVNNELLVTKDYQSLRFASLPPDLIAEPTLVWRVKATAAGKRTVSTTYLTSGMTWKADYVLELPASADKAALNGWVSVENNSGAAFRDAKLQLVAGDVNQVTPGPRVMRALAADAVQVEEAGSLQQREVFEYHLYTLPRKTTLKDRQHKQVALLSSSGVKVEREYRLQAEQLFTWQKPGTSEERVSVHLKFTNTTPNGLGVPLPRGIVRVYQRDTEGGSIFLGEDQINHTPRDEAIALRVGNAFDIVAERTQTDWKTVSADTTESEWRIVLRNRKAEAIMVNVFETIGEQATVLSHSHPFQKRSAATVEFAVPVAAGAESALVYRVRVRR